jgi:putative ABC transport system substrate-binding protein
MLLVLSWGIDMRRRDFITLIGGAIAVPTAAWAQQAKKIPTVAYLWHAGNADEEEPYFSAVGEGFTKLGYTDGQNIKLIHRFPNEKPEAFQSMAAELVSMNVDVLMGGGIAAPYLKEATSTIPIVFMFVADPVGINLIQDFAKPGGNATGLSNFGRDIAGKRRQPELADAAVQSDFESSRSFSPMSSRRKQRRQRGKDDE